MRLFFSADLTSKFCAGALDVIRLNSTIPKTYFIGIVT